VVTKTRLAKRYRVPALDDRIRRERLRTEAALLSAARRAGVPVPLVLDVDTANHLLVLQRIAGPTLRQALAESPDRAADLLTTWGGWIGRLHEAGIVHGDLTTSNAIVGGDGIVLIDFGLAARSNDVEDRGVDLVLVQRTLESTHPSEAEAWFARVAAGYTDAVADGQHALDRMREIRGRARYV
jgi:TP53 regulating kinase-like protein